MCCSETDHGGQSCCDSGGHPHRHGSIRCDCGEGIARRFLRPFALLLLAEKPSHGYDLARSLSELAPEGLSADPSVLYRLLRQMEDEGLATSSLDASGAGPARKVYELTGDGQEALDLWACSLEGLGDLFSSFKSRYDAVRAR